MSQNSPCQDFVTWWIGGTRTPAWNGPWLPIGEHRVTKLGLWLAQWPLGRPRWPWVQNYSPQSICAVPLRVCPMVLMRPVAKVQAVFPGDSLGAVCLFRLRSSVQLRQKGPVVQLLCATAPSHLHTTHIATSASDPASAIRRNLSG